MCAFAVCVLLPPCDRHLGDQGKVRAILGDSLRTLGQKGPPETPAKGYLVTASRKFVTLSGIEFWREEVTSFRNLVTISGTQSLF